jgi:hypothetical protein
MLKLGLVSLLSVGAAFTSATAAAQTVAPAVASSGAPETLFQNSGRPQRSIGWYVAPTEGFTSIDGRFGYTVGLRSALVLNRTWGFGLAGNLLGTNRTSDSTEDEIRDVGYYGGAYFQYVLGSTRLVHAFADLTAGGGSFCERALDDGCTNRRDFAFAEPTINLEMNVFKFMRVTAGAGYRAALAEKGPGLDSRQLSGVVARTSLVFGMF